MAKVRAQALLDRRRTEKQLRDALKTVAKIQDQQQAQDVEGEHLVMAPSLRRCKATMLPLPHHIVPSMVTEPGPNTRDNSNEEVAAGEGDTEKDDSLRFEDEDSSDSDSDDIVEEGTGQG